MQRHKTTTEAPQHKAPDASDPHFRDQNETESGAAPDDATTVAFEGHMKVSGDDEFAGDPYNRTGRFKRSVR